MKLFTITRWHKLDWGIIISSFFLVLISLAILYSLELNQDSPDFSLLKRQAIAAGMGMASLWFLLFLDFRHIKDFAYILYGAGIIILIAVLLFGTAARGTTGWFSIGGFHFQPVEIFKVILIIALAKFYSARSSINQFKTLILSLLLILGPAVLIYFQPDLGSLMVLAIVWFGYLLVMKLKLNYILIFCAILFLTIALSWQFFLAPYQKERIITFLEPESDIAGTGYNVRQSKIAIGSGRLWGRGLGLGTQSSLNFLPEQETDFIFAVIAESLGFLGGGLLISLYGFLLWRIIRLTIFVKDEFGAFLAFGVFFWFAFQGFANIAMNLGLAPVIGVPLPFVSYGGSSMLACLIAIGMLESVCIYAGRADP
ncbi:MAG: rod shape-determining protein RodA [Patescibacteria group bacterium]